MKKSITLFVTLIFIIAGISLITAILATYKKITSTSFDFISQNSKIIKNIKDNLKNRDLNTTVNLFYIPLSFSSKDNSFRLNVQIEPICSININDYLKNNKIDYKIDSFLDYIANKYAIEDIVFFKDLLLDTIDKDDIERSPFSEIKLINPHFQDGNLTQRNFETILKYYVKKTNDKKILAINWREYFNFYKTQLFKECVNKDILEFNYENKNKFTIISYSDNISNFYIKIIAQYILKTEHTLSLLYDLKQKKVIDIEENPIY